MSICTSHWSSFGIRQAIDEDSWRQTVTTLTSALLSQKHREHIARMVGSLIVSLKLGLTTLTCSHMPRTQAPPIQRGEEPGYDMIAMLTAVL